MNREVTQIITAADALKATVDGVANFGDNAHCNALIRALDQLDAATEALRRAPRMPDVRGLWDRRMTVEAMYWPAVYFDAQFNGEALAELVEELDELGTTGTPRSVTAATAEKIRRGEFEGLIARVTMFRTEESRWSGVITAEDFETLALRAIEWGDAVLKRHHASRAQLTLVKAA